MVSFVYCLIPIEQPELSKSVAFKSLVDVLFHSQTNTVVTRLQHLELLIWTCQPYVQMAGVKSPQYGLTLSKWQVQHQ